ncbi:MAG TPA: hypothetical protein VJ001_09980 [Rhodocyclaceae bacterium]|nr:hypothetical protein [Rhodocyclaceae bacterium]
MNLHLKQRIDESLEFLSEQHMAEVLDFVESLKEKQRQAIQNNAAIEKALEEFRQLLKSPPKGRLTAIELDLSGFKFNRDEANER